MVIVKTIVSNPSKNFRYLSKLHYSVYSMFSQFSVSHFNLSSSSAKTLVSAIPFWNPICNSYLLNPTSHNSYSSISITGSFLFCSETYPSSHHPLYLCKYHGCRRLSTFSPNGSPLVSSMTCPYSQSSNCLGFSRCNGRYNGDMSKILNLYLFKSRAHGCFRLYSVSSIAASQHKKLGADGLRPNATAKEVSKIIKWIKSDKDGWESKLKFLNVKLSIASVTHVFKVLNGKKKSALQFFHWIRVWQPELVRNSHICSLVVNNCGRLNDYGTMRCILNDFSSNRLSLTKKAFEFLLVMAANEALLRKSTQSVIHILHEVGGTCYGTGVHSLIEMFCVLESFDMAKFVIEKTERKLTYYSVLIREMCRRSNFEGVENVMDEMRKAGCSPSTQSYNYVISSLLKNGKNADACRLFKGIEKDCPPDALTFEIFICDSCRDGNLDIAFEFLNEVAARGLEPRLSTHATFIKGLFNSQQYEEAYKYVVSSDDKCSSCMNYSLLASLHQKRGDLVAAENILSEMIKKGLRPYFKVYLKVLKNLRESGKEKLAADLREKFRQLEF